MSPNEIWSTEPHSASLASQTLHEIAETLGIPIELLTAPAQPHLLHREEDGEHWLLLHDVDGRLVVRHVGLPGHVSHAVEESISSFLVRHPDSLAHRALISLIEQLLNTHIAG